MQYCHCLCLSKTHSILALDTHYVGDRGGYKKICSYFFVYNKVYNIHTPMMTTLSKVSIKNGKCPSPLHFTQDYFRVFCIFQNQVLHLQSYLLTICNSKSIIHDCSHLKRLHKGSAQCWGLLGWKLFRKFGLFRSSI